MLKAVLMREAVVVFADIVGCSEVSASTTVQDYDYFIGQFQGVAVETWQQVKEARQLKDCEAEFSVRGDEALVVLHRNEYLDDPADAGYSAMAFEVPGDLMTCDALLFCTALKFAWYQSPHNRSRYRLLIPPRELAIGASYGPMTHRVREDGKLRPEGFILNITKRIEGEARKGQQSHIFVTEPIYHWRFTGLAFMPSTSRDLRGFPPQRLFEVRNLSPQVFERLSHHLVLDCEFGSNVKDVVSFLRVCRASESEWLKCMAAVMIAKDERIAKMAVGSLNVNDIPLDKPSERDRYVAALGALGLYLGA